MVQRLKNKERLDYCKLEKKHEQHGSEDLPIRNSRRVCTINTRHLRLGNASEQCIKIMTH